MDNRQGLDRDELLSGTILDLAGRLSGTDLKLTDFIRLLQLSEELDEGTAARVKAGWVNQCQKSGGTKDE